MKYNKITFYDYTEEDKDKLVDGVAKNNVPATLLIIMHNQAALNEKLNRLEDLINSLG